MMGKYKMIRCPQCGEIIDEESIFCTNCGTHRPTEPLNRCENPECVQCRKGINFKPGVLYCNLCGKPTTIGKEVEKNI